MKLADKLHQLEVDGEVIYYAHNGEVLHGEQLDEILRLAKRGAAITTVIKECGVSPKRKTVDPYCENCAIREICQEVQQCQDSQT